jgi:predicted nicotinamide N-methyase
MTEPTTLQSRFFRYTLRTTSLFDAPHTLQVGAALSFEAVAPWPGDSRLQGLPLGSGVWPSAVLACMNLLQHPRRVAGQRVLDLGCGLGLCAVLAARLGAEAHAMDAHPDMALFVEHNARLNGVTVAHAVAEFSRMPPGTFDGVVAADCLYEAAAVNPLADALQNVVEPHGWALVVCPGRGHIPRMLRKLEARGFSVTHQHVAPAALQVTGAPELLARHPPLTHPLEVLWAKRGGPF